MSPGGTPGTVARIAQDAAPVQFALDLSEGTIVACHGRSVAIMEPPGVYEAHDTAHIRHETGQNGDPRIASAFVAVFRAGRLSEDGTYHEIERYELDHGHAIYGKKLLEGNAYYADGTAEGWRIQVDPLNMRWNWTRQPDQPHDRLVIRLVTPAPEDRFTLWQTGRGATYLSGENAPFVAPDESEVLCVGPTLKNSFRIEVPSGGELTLTQHNSAANRLSGEPGWETARVPAIEAQWVIPPVAVLRIDASWGLAPAALDFQGRQPFRPVQATLDFDTFFSRMALAALPLYLSGGDRDHYIPLATLAAGAPPAPLHDIAMACEFLPLADPRAAGVLMRDTIDRFLEEETGPRDSALLLLLAGRYAAITGDPDFLGARLAQFRALADGLLAMRAKDNVLPLIDTEDGPAKEPCFTALCYAALKRLAAMEHGLAAPEQSKKWLTAAEAIRLAALTPYTEGGLLHPARGVFVRHTFPGDSPEPTRNARARTEFQLSQFVVPCVLGLMDDAAQIQRAYDWIDDQYTYATGRGGASAPPGAERGLYALLDVYVRQSRGVTATDRVLQYVLDHALDFGVPMLGRPYTARRAPSANFADAAPYLGIVLGQHYGLSYTRDGWHLHTPKPLANYPLTRVTGVRHKHATYSLTWQGRGRIKRIVVDGRTHRTPLLQDAEGDHEVTIYLG